jgi:hypothetical protein
MMGTETEKIKISNTLIRPVGTYGAECWTLNKGIAKMLVILERKMLRRMCGEIKANGNWRKQDNKELMQLFGDLDILSFIGISVLNWNGHVYRMDSKRNISQIFNNNPQGSRLSERQKTDGGTMYKQILIDAKLQIGQRGQKQRLLGEVH